MEMCPKIALPNNASKTKSRQILAKFFLKSLTEEVIRSKQSYKPGQLAIQNVPEISCLHQGFDLKHWVVFAEKCLNSIQKLKRKLNSEHENFDFNLK